ncbi:hypothetical protein HDV00_011552 [Rhizophlyctis rosea]|nr:hypothetical protein HDV00_011552 [Rhizophlyctis rosea]
MTQWYEHAYPDAAKLAQMFAESEWPSWGVQSANRFASISELTDANEIDTQLHQMLVHEQFPLSAYFFSIEGQEVWDEELTILRHPLVKERLKLSDLIPRIDAYVDEPEYLSLMVSMQKEASEMEKSLFHDQVEGLMQINPELVYWSALFNDFPDALSHETRQAFDLRKAIRSSSPHDIHSLIADGALLTIEQLFYDLSYNIRNFMDIEGWCQAITAFHKKHPNLTWCRDCDSQHPDSTTAATEPSDTYIKTFRLMFNALYSPIRSSMGLVNNMYLARIEMGVKSGEFDWWECYVALEIS